MTYLDQHTLATSGDFQARVSMAALAQVFVVVGELVTVQNHAERLALAYRVVGNPMEIVPRLSRLAVVGDAVTAASTDAELLARISTLWTPLALANV